MAPQTHGRWGGREQTGAMPKAHRGSGKVFGKP